MILFSYIYDLFQKGQTQNLVWIIVIKHCARELISGHRFHVYAFGKNFLIVTWQFSLNCNLIELTGELHAIRDALTTR